MDISYQLKTGNKMTNIDAQIEALQAQLEVLRAQKRLAADPRNRKDYQKTFLKFKTLNDEIWEKYCSEPEVFRFNITVDLTIHHDFDGHEISSFIGQYNLVSSNDENIANHIMKHIKHMESEDVIYELNSKNTQEFIKTYNKFHSAIHRLKHSYELMSDIYNE